jgi:hypothetical protein
MTETKKLKLLIDEMNEIEPKILLSILYYRCIVLTTVGHCISKKYHLSIV